MCGFLLCSEVQVGVNICCCCECAVSQPDLNLLHRDSAAEKQAGAGVSEIMKANLFQAVLFDEPCEMFCHIVGTQELAALVDADVVEVISAVGLFEETAEHLLFLLFFQQKLLDSRNER